MVQKLTDNDEEPAAGLDVEKEIYIPMPRQREVLKEVKIADRPPREPRLILPEKLPDE
jgi:hypothetical protein